MILPRPIYSGLLYAAAPAAMLYLYKRSRKQPQYLEHWSERFGTAHYPPRTKGRTRIWIHAVSVGETRATFSLVESILKRWPNTEILYTHMTPTGREVGAKFAQKFGNRIAQCYNQLADQLLSVSGQHRRMVYKECCRRLDERPPGNDVPASG